MKADELSQKPPFCPKCERDGDIWRSETKEIEQVFKGEQFLVPARMSVCCRCGFALVDPSEATAIAKATADAYREKHSLLTSAQIVERRKQLGMSQQQFARHLNVGVASVKRWELGSLQDKSSDALIRAKTDDKQYWATVVEGYITGVRGSLTIVDITAMLRDLVSEGSFRPDTARYGFLKARALDVFCASARFCELNIHTLPQLDLPHVNPVRDNWPSLSKPTKVLNRASWEYRAGASLNIQELEDAVARSA